MKRSTRMLLMNGGKDKKKIEFEYEWPAQGHWGPYMPPYYDDRGMEPESAFYDRRGRKHYDNGRYAPMSEYGEPENARRYRRYSDGRFAPRSEYMPMEEPWSEGVRFPRMEREPDYNADSPRMIGFGRSWENPDMSSDATMPRIMEMDYLRGQKSRRGGAYSSRLPKFDQRMAIDWTASLVNADGKTGPHWTMDETDKLHAQYNLTCDKLEFWVVMNSLYSDYCEALRGTSLSTHEVYVRLAEAWINDKDAVPDKAAAYYTYVVKH